ncbi:MAG: peptidase domain-containing ABC transporter [Prevotellaceae bacterium]|jgi:ATP-binding cassette subfamily B protein|nr:peptidase domain-containing ABC transporter [Prevotellaceae bacterium]
MSQFPFTHQHDAMDCGPACLQMIAKHYGRNYTLQGLRDNCFLTRQGVSLLGISDAAEKIGFRTTGVRITFEQLTTAPLPCIVHVKQCHFVVVYRIEKTNKNDYTLHIADPGFGKIKCTKEEFCQYWIKTKDKGEDRGLALLLEPTPDFYALEGERDERTKLSFLFKYLRPYYKLITQLFLGMLLGTLLLLIFPFLTQSIVDYGINSSNLSFVTLVLIAQLTLFTAQTAVEFIRSWILLHISTRINISIISDFLIKLMKLPIGFFDTKMIGDIMQRIGDHSRIQSFLTSTTLTTLFSIVSFVVFVGVLAFYNTTLLLVFLIASTLYVLWVMLFLKRRKELDYKRFIQASTMQSNLYQMITGMQEIKQNNCERQKRWEWERIQAKLFRISVKGLALSQYQQSGAFFINETKNIIISFFAAHAVITGNMTLGMMMAVQYIIGQLNAPISQFIGFIQSAQDAKISLERLNEIHSREDEEQQEAGSLSFLPEEYSFTLRNLSFQYDGPHSEMVLKDLNLIIPPNKTTAIVGMSGSGKTTLVKLLLGFYSPTKGEILVGDTQLDNLSKRIWRDACGAVMQDGFIFSDTIARNIAVSDENVNPQQLLHALKVANLRDLIDTLPLGVNTKIGQEGHGLSQGQKQRILIARAVYKNPTFLFFDEATNALDANNERVIMENLEAFFKGKTVVIVAHRLSTVKNADRIVVLNKGYITETGTHAELTALRGEYYELVKNQLELGS